MPPKSRRPNASPRPSRPNRQRRKRSRPAGSPPPSCTRTPNASASRNAVCVKEAEAKKKAEDAAKSEQTKKQRMASATTPARPDRREPHSSRTCEAAGTDVALPGWYVVKARRHAVGHRRAPLQGRLALQAHLRLEPEARCAVRTASSPASASICRRVGQGQGLTVGREAAARSTMAAAAAKASRMQRLIPAAKAGGGTTGVARRLRPSPEQLRVLQGPRTLCVAVRPAGPAAHGRSSRSC